YGRPRPRSFWSRGGEAGARGVEMRATCGLLLALAAAGLCATGARAAEPGHAKRNLTPAQRALLNDIYTPAPVPQKSARRPSHLVATTLGVRANSREIAGTGEVFRMPPVT